MREWLAAVDVVRIARVYASEKLRHAASRISLDTAVLCVSTGRVPFRAQSLSLCRDFQCMSFCKSFCNSDSHDCIDADVRLTHRLLS